MDSDRTAYEEERDGLRIIRCFTGEKTAEQVLLELIRAHSEESC